MNATAAAHTHSLEFSNAGVLPLLALVSPVVAALAVIVIERVFEPRIEASAQVELTDGAAQRRSRAVAVAYQDA